MLKKLWIKIRSFFPRVISPTNFLCDSCKFDYRGACDNPKRPNVTSCPDYKRR